MDNTKVINEGTIRLVDDRHKLGVILMAKQLLFTHRMQTDPEFKKAVEKRTAQIISDRKNSK
jgi:hypothetical protein